MLRLAPPLIITEEQAQTFVEALPAILDTAAAAASKDTAAAAASNDTAAQNDKGDKA